MAEEENYEFTPPDFDEDAFIHKEMVSFRATVILFIWGIIVSLATWGIFLAMAGDKNGWLLSLALVAASGYALKFIFPALGTDISHYKRREWLGTGFLFFFTWLAFAILLVNPPISDFTDPTADIFISPSNQMLGGDVVIDVFFGDNGKLSDFEFEVSRGGEVQADLQAAERVSKGHYRFTATAWPAGSYTITAGATDAKGHSVEQTHNFQIRGNSNALAVRASIPDTLDSLQGNFIIVQVPGDIVPYAVYAQIEGQLGRVHFEEDESIGGWKASAIFKGWQNGNNTFTIVVEEENRFIGQTLVTGGKVVMGPYSIDVQGASGVYDKSVKQAQSVDPPNRAVPGMEMGLVAVGLVAIAAVVRKRQ